MVECRLSCQGSLERVRGLPLNWPFAPKQEHGFLYIVLLGSIKQSSGSRGRARGMELVEGI